MSPEFGLKRFVGRFLFFFPQTIILDTFYFFAKLCHVRIWRSNNPNQFSSFICVHFLNFVIMPSDNAAKCSSVPTLPSIFIFITSNLECS